MLRQFGAFAEGDEFEFGGDEPTGLWMNQPVKTHAVVVFAAVESAQLCAEALDVGLTIHPHPTLGESVMEAAKAALGEAIHVVNR